MEKVNITVVIEATRLDALTYFMKKENTTAQKELEKALEELYQKHVPADTREYIDSKLHSSAPSKPRPKRTAAATTILPPAVMTNKEDEDNG